MLRDEEGYSMISDYYGMQPFDPNVDLKVDSRKRAATQSED